MKAQGQHRTFIRYAFTCMLVLLVAGCGGGGGEPAPSNGNTPPPDTTAGINDTVIADAGNIVAVRVDQVAALDGSASSTTLSDPLEYSWSFSAKPAGSNAQLLGATSVTPSFTADVIGTYRVDLIVTAGDVSSQRAMALVEVTVPGDDFTGIRVHTSFPSQCSDCHDGRYAVVVPPFDPVPPKSPLHIATSNDCQACHTTFGFELIRFVDHRDVFGNCSTCHNGTIAIGKSEFHIETTGECDDCHTTTSFLQLEADGTFNHTGIISNCVRCHNDSLAIGKASDPTPPHPDTTSDCSSCHTTTGFIPAYPDHSGPDVVGQRCDTCHNATGGTFNASDQPVGHPVMTRLDDPTMVVDCDVCHSTRRFSMGGVFNHRVADPTALACSTCHNGNNSINARGKVDDPTPPHPTTTTDCGVCHGVGGGNFALAIYDHTNDVNNCGTAGCHDPASIEGIYAAGSTHIASNGNDCENCHVPGNFATGFYDHAGVTNGCSSCHNDQITAGTPVNHIPTTEDCSVCHIVKFDDFTGATFNHAGITNNCASCHDGNIATGKIRNHMPTTEDCSVCHAASMTTFTNFTGGDFNHLVGVNNNCATCHDGVIAIDKKVDHIPAQRECSQCHADTNPGGFATSTFIADVHPGVSGGCEGCHTSRFFPTLPVIKAANHVPTNQDCHSCHTNVAFIPQIFTHAGISGNCESCHDGNYAVPAGALGKADDPTPPHPTTTADCGACHGIGANFQDGDFDHTGRTSNCNECHADGATGAVTKKNVGHLPTAQDCSVCHVPGTFTTAVFSHTGIVDNCSSCHGDTATGAVTKKDANHVTTGDDCSVCHNPDQAFANARYDHTGIDNNCASCHDGNIARGKDGLHVPTNDDCSVCHQTTGFIPGTFEHIGIVDNCASCHDGGFARGKNGGHVQTSLDCGACHTTHGFIPAQHSTVSSTTRCDSCHGVNATGQHAAHLTTNLDCRSCHTTSTFIGGTWVHDASTAGTCNSCHVTGGGATPQPTSGHFDTTVQCDSCHVTTGWSPANTFDHCAGQNTSNLGTCSGSLYPGNHNRTLACITCHAGNSDIPTYRTAFDRANPANRLEPDCAGCHRDQFESEGDHIGGSSGTVFQNRDCSGGGRGCHKVNDGGF